MPRQKKNQDQSTGDQSKVQSRVNRVDQAPVITMSEFMARPDKAEWLTFKDVALLMQLPLTSEGSYRMQTFRNALNNRAEFADQGAILRVQIEGYDLRPLTYINSAAVSRYLANKDVDGRHARVRGDSIRRIVILTGEQFDAYNNGELALTVDKFPLAPAYYSKKRKAEEATIAERELATVELEAE